MKRFFLAIVLFSLCLACGSPSEQIKYAKELKIEKSGSVLPVEEISDIDSLPQKCCKIYLDDKGRIAKHDEMENGTLKRHTKYVYNKDGKILEAKHFENGKYNGVSKYAYNDSGEIEKEMVYDREFHFLYSKNF